jgi:hypothetical protein
MAVDGGKALESDQEMLEALLNVAFRTAILVVGRKLTLETAWNGQDRSRTCFRELVVYSLRRERNNGDDRVGKSSILYLFPP